jgi:hypothetical protein
MLARHKLSRSAKLDWEIYNRDGLPDDKRRANRSPESFIGKKSPASYVQDRGLPSEMVVWLATNEVSSASTHSTRRRWHEGLFA